MLITDRRKIARMFIARVKAFAMKNNFEVVSKYPVMVVDANTGDELACFEEIRIKTEDENVKH